MATTTEEFATRKFTVDEYVLAAEAGAFGEDRTELIDGEVYVMPPTGPPHNASMGRLTHLLVTRLGGKAIVLPASSLHLSRRSMPEPDFAILHSRADFYEEKRIEPSDVVALVEVSVTSLKFDRSKKASAYARGGIPEYWIVNPRGREVERYRSPHELGYRERHVAMRGERIAFEAFPDVAFGVEEIVGAG